MSILVGVQPKMGRMSRLRSFGGSWLFVLSCAILVGFVLMAILAPVLAPYPPDATDLLNSLAPPSSEHWLGTNQVGQDTLSRIIYGARTSLIGPLAIVILSTIFGILLGLIAGWRGGWVDAGLSRVFDIMFAFPALLLAILVVALFGKGLLAPVIAMSIAYTPFVARLVRSLVMQAKARPYIAAYKVQGFGSTHIASRRLLPNIAPTVLAQSTLNFGYAMIDLAALSFLGLGVQPPTPDWGAMINEGRGAILAGTPLSAVAPALAIVIVVVAFNIVGEELADRIAGRDLLMAALLEIENLSLHLPGRAERPILDDVTLAVAAGEMVGLVGESGSGKSVTARTVLGLWPDQSEVEGAVRVGDCEVLSASRERLLELRRSEVSMIFQDPRAGINPIRRVGDFLTESLRRNHHVPKDRARTQAVDLLRAVGLDDPERHFRQYPHELSGGMLQRVMIAGALTVQPKLLLCDEPTTALDVTTQAEILQILKKLQAEREMGVLFITHDLDLAAAVCDRVYVMYAGRIVESASATRVFGAPAHPYTAGLLSSTPDLSGDHRRLVPIKGTPLSLLEKPTGCSFTSRCAYAVEGFCDVEVPDLIATGGHSVRCLRSEELATELSTLVTRGGDAR